MLLVVVEVAERQKGFTMAERVKVSVDLEDNVTRKLEGIRRQLVGLGPFSEFSPCVKCSHCGQWAAVFTACVHCGAPVDPQPPHISIPRVVTYSST